MKKIMDAFEALRTREPLRLAVSAAADADVIQAVAQAVDGKIVIASLVGDKSRILELCAELNIDPSKFDIIDVPDAAASAAEAVKLVSGGKADIIMKGQVQSGVFLKALLDPEFGLRKENSAISSIAVMETAERLMLITDPGFIPAPDLEMKKKILVNAVDVAQRLGIAEPKVAVLCASEAVSAKMQATVDAKTLEDMNQAGEITGCTVAGPISLDLAVSEHSAKHKGYSHPVAGKADILLVPTIEVGNVLYKSLVYFANLPTGGVMTGARAPIVFTSRADSAETKANTIALAAYLAGKE